MERFFHILYSNTFVPRIDECDHYRLHAHRRRSMANYPKDILLNVLTMKFIVLHWMHECM